MFLEQGCMKGWAFAHKIQTSDCCDCIKFSKRRFDQQFHPRC